MKRGVFNPGFIILVSGYDQGSSGGNYIVTPGIPGHSYYDRNTGRTYFYIDGEGWYYQTDTSADDVWYGTELDTTGMEEIPIV